MKIRTDQNRSEHPDTTDTANPDATHRDATHPDTTDTIDRDATEIY